MCKLYMRDGECKNSFYCEFLLHVSLFLNLSCIGSCPSCLQCFDSVGWGGRKGIRPVKHWVVRCWRGYLSGARCRLACCPADTTASCFSKIQIGFTFLVLAHPGSPRKRAVKRVYVCVLDQVRQKRTCWYKYNWSRFYTGQMPFLFPTDHGQSTEWNLKHWTRS